VTAHRTRLGRALLERVDVMAERLVSRRPDLPGYAGPSDASLRRIIVLHLRALVEFVFISPGRYQPEIEPLARVASAARVREGVPLDSILRTAPVVLQTVWSEAVDLTRELRLPPEVLLDCAHLALEFEANAMRMVAAAYREIELEHVQRDVRRRDEFVQRVLMGAAAHSEINAEALAHGMPIDHDYVAFRARQRVPDPLALERVIVPLIRGRGLATISGEDVIGFATRVPSVESDVVIGVGAPMPLASLGSSFTVASRVLDTAYAFAQRGTFSLANISLRAPVVSESEIGTLLVERYLGPLDELGAFGKIIEDTVRRFFARDMDVDEVARELVVHPNTVRYRLERFEHLTGANLRRLRDLTELWWALERRSIETGHEPEEATDGDRPRGDRRSLPRRRARDV
jgi:hypothetical protein